MPRQARSTDSSVLLRRCPRSPVTGLARALWTLALVATLLPGTALGQAGGGVETGSSAALDVVVLRNGSRVEGRIVKETPKVVELRIDASTVVGLPRAHVASVERAPRAAAPSEGTSEPGAAPAGETVPPGDAGRRADDAAEAGRRGPSRPEAARPEPGATLYDQWHVVHNEEGTALGWMQATVTQGDDGVRRIGEEWRFFDADGARTEITIQDVVDASARPMRTFYHERQFDPQERVLSTRIVRATLRSNLLEVVTEDAGGSRKASYRAPEGTRFPLELRDSVRRLQRGPDEPAFTVFDARSEQFEQRTQEITGFRRVSVDGEELRVRVMESETSSGRVLEWLDGGANAVRRELAGGALVATPADRSALQAMTRQQAGRFPSRVRSEPDGRFALRLPNAQWRFDESRIGGRVAAHAEELDGTASLILLDHLDERLTIESATDAVERWFALLHTRFEVDSRVPVASHLGRSMRLRGRTHARGGRARRVEIHVFDGPHGFMAFVGSAALESWEDLRQDFGDMVRRLELQPEAGDPIEVGLPPSRLGTHPGVPGGR